MTSRRKKASRTARILRISSRASFSERRDLQNVALGHSSRIPSSKTQITCSCPSLPLSSMQTLLGGDTEGWKVMAEKLDDLWHQRKKSGLALDLLPRISILVSSLCLILLAKSPKSLGQGEPGEPSTSHWVG